MTKKKKKGVTKKKNHEAHERRRLNGVFSIEVAAGRMKALLPEYERCDGFGCIVTPSGILHDADCSAPHSPEVRR